MPSYQSSLFWKWHGLGGNGEISLIDSVISDGRPTGVTRSSGALLYPPLPLAHRSALGIYLLIQGRGAPRYARKHPCSWNPPRTVRKVTSGNLPKTESEELCQIQTSKLVSRYRNNVDFVQGYMYLTHKKAHPPRGPYRRPMPRVLRGSQWGGRFVMSEVPRNTFTAKL